MPSTRQQILSKEFLQVMIAAGMLRDIYRERAKETPSLKNYWLNRCAEIEAGLNVARDLLNDAICSSIREG